MIRDKIKSQSGIQSGTNCVPSKVSAGKGTNFPKADCLAQCGTVGQSELYTMSCCSL